MAETKVYEEGGFRIELIPEGDPYQGNLVTRFPEMAPYAADVNLAKKRSRSEYANDAADVWGVEEGSELAKDLKRTLNAVYVTRMEEVAAAREAEQEVAEPAEVHPGVSEEEMAELVGKPGVLERLTEAVTTYSGVVGERPALKVIALCALSAQLALLPNAKPIAANVIISAGAGRGKNYLCDAVVRPLPPEFYFPFESASGKAFFYMAEDDPAFLKYRFIYPNEAEGTDQAVELFRPLLSGGKARHNTVNQDARGRLAYQEFVIEGPVSLAIPTVRNKLDNQLQTRMLILGLEDYEGRVAAHSRAVSGLLSPSYVGVNYMREIETWQAALRSLTGVRKVVIPVDCDRFRFDSDEVSHGARLWSNLLGLMSSHAWLEQRNREIRVLPSGEHTVVATAEDYAVAYDLFESACERSVKNLSDTHRRVLSAVYELQQLDKRLRDRVYGYYDPEAYTQREIAKSSSVPQSTISDNKTFLVKSAKLLVETSSGKLRLVEGADPSWWAKGDILAGFPKPEQVRAWWYGEDNPPDPETPGHTGRAHEATARHDGTGENGDWGSSGRHPEASGQPAQDKAGHHDDRPDDRDDRHAPGREDALDKRENASEDEPTGLTGGSEDHEEKVEAEDGEKSHAHDGAHEDLLAKKERLLGPGWESETAGTKLTRLGWTRDRSVASDDRTETSRSLEEELPGVKRDPVAREVQRLMFWSDCKVTTAAELIEGGRRGKDSEHSRSIACPATPREMHEHLESITPAHQGAYPYCEPYPVQWNYPMRIEYWIKAGSDQGLWVFSRAYQGSVDDEVIESYVWREVERLEGLRDDDGFNFGD